MNRNNDRKLIIKLKKKLKLHNESINDIKTFPSGNIISISSDKSIKILNKNFTIIQTILNAHEKEILSCDIKNENTFLTSSNDLSIKIWIKKGKKYENYTIIKNTHKDYIYKAIFFPKSENIISCYNEIKIWEKNIKDNSYQNITIIKDFHFVFSLLFIQEKKMLISAGWGGVSFWKLNEYKLIKHISDISCWHKNAIIKLDNDKILLGGDFFKCILKVFSLSQMKIISEIKNDFQCYSLFQLNHLNYFLCGGGNDNINIYNTKNYKFVEKVKGAHNDIIYGFFEIKDNNYFGSFSKDGTIKIWNYNHFI